MPSYSLYLVVDSFRRKINPPGQDLYPAMTDDEAVGRMSDAFWELRLRGLEFLNQWTCDDNGTITTQANAPATPLGSLVPVSFYEDDSSGQLGREIIQAIIVVAAYQVVLSALQSQATSTTYKAGPVEVQTQFSASVLKGVQQALKDEWDDIRTRLSDLGTTSVVVLDAVFDASANLRSGQTSWVR